MRRAYFDFHGLRLSYLEAGEMHDRKLFIAHANGYAAGCYDYLIEALSADFHVCALDFAGHGASEGTLAFDSWDFFRDQITAFFAHKNWKHCIAIGHSLGGGSLLRAAIENSEQFEKVIAFDPVMLSFPAVIYVKLFGNPMARVALARRADFKNKEQALKIFSRHPANRNWEKGSVRAYVEYCIRETKEGGCTALLRPRYRKPYLFASRMAAPVTARAHTLRGAIDSARPFECLSPAYCRLRHRETSPVGYRTRCGGRAPVTV